MLNMLYIAALLAAGEGAARMRRNRVRVTARRGRERLRAEAIRNALAREDATDAP